MKHIIFILIAMFALVACQDADVISYAGSPSQGDLRVAIRVPKFDDINVGTRGTKSGEESKVTNMYMFIIDNSGNIAYSQFEEGDKPLFTIDRQELANQGKVLTEAKIVVVANATAAVKSSLDAATNLAGIYACDYTLSSGTDCIDIPEIGFPMMSDEYPVDLHQPAGTSTDPDKLKGSVLEIPLKCLYAKIVFNISVQPTQSVSSVDQSFQVKSWKVYNIPTKVNLGVPADNDQTKFAEKNCEWVGSDARDNTNKADNLIYESSQESDSLTFHFYMPEHKVNPKYTGSDVNYPWDPSDDEKYADYRQYLKPTLVQDKTSPVHPCETDKKAACVEINGIYKDHNNIEREVTYTIYLGADNYQNFHILRNHQYNNSVIIKGIKNSTAVGSTDWVTYDHRVNVKQDAFTFGLQRETLLDSHWEIRPIRIDFNKAEASDAVVEVIVPNDCNWLSIESPSNTEIEENANKYCEVNSSHTAYGKRRYYTTNLNTELNGTKKIIIHRDANKDQGHTIAKIDGHDAHTVWAYIDENTSNPGGAQYRYATVTCNYYASEAAYNNGKGTPTVSEDYIFRQNNLHKIVYNDNTYYIEYYEEYLYNYDSKEQYGNTTDGMEWGLDGVQLSTQYGAVAMGNANWSSASILGGIIKGIVDDKINELISNLKNEKKYDFYLSRDLDNITNAQGNLTYRDRNGIAFTKDIVTAAGIEIQNLTTDGSPESAIEYCLNKNKRNSDGTITLSNVKWYMPAIDEIEDITSGGYADFEVFQDKLYWSSQPAYKKYGATFNGTYRSILGAWAGSATVKVEGSYFEDNNVRARATKTTMTGSARTNVTSGSITNGTEFVWGTLKFTQSGTSQNAGDVNTEQPVENDTGIKYDDGNCPRTGQKNRVRCVYKP